MKLRILMLLLSSAIYFLNIRNANYIYFPAGVVTKAAGSFDLAGKHKSTLVTACFVSSRYKGQGSVKGQRALLF